MQLLLPPVAGRQCRVLQQQPGPSLH
jgi:hypothetical protein